ncbi:hypothetical protein B0H13DRAFT_1657479, partial [Mycena leptocephala]
TGHAVPPFYMIAFAVGGAPITTLIGMNESDLSWTVSHPIVVDSHGNTGGIAPPLYTTTDFYMTANVTDVLATCAPWGLTVHGGMPPYTLTLAALDSPSVTNVTLGPNGSMFTYINRANPGSQMIGMFLGFYPFTSSSIIHIDDELASVSGSYVKHPRSLPSGCT